MTCAVTQCTFPLGLANKRPNGIPVSAWNARARVLPLAPTRASPLLEGPAVGGAVAVSNVGDDRFWTGYPLAQANLFAFGRLAWDPSAEPAALLAERIGMTFGDSERVRETLHAMMDESWHVYEQYTAPLGVGFMVRPSTHLRPRR